MRAATRAAFVKDVALPRALDDGTHATLASLAVFNSVEVLVALQADPHFLPTLFARLRSEPPGSDAWADGAALVQEMVDTARHLQASSRGALLTRLAGLGLFDVMASALVHGGGIGVGGVGGSGARAGPSAGASPSASPSATPPTTPPPAASAPPRAGLRARAADVLLSAAGHDAAPLREFLLADPGQAALHAICKATQHAPAAEMPANIPSSRAMRLHMSSASVWLT